jgi:hypothetical protein
MPKLRTTWSLVIGVVPRLREHDELVAASPGLRPVPVNVVLPRRGRHCITFPFSWAGISGSRSRSSRSSPERNASSTTRRTGLNEGARVTAEEAPAEGRR